MKACPVTIRAVFVAATLGPLSASAHPLGNFTVNHLARIAPRGDGVAVRLIADLAEIPTFQAMPEIDADGDGRVSDTERDACAARWGDRVVREFELRLDGSPLPLRAQEVRAALVPSPGGLATLRLVADLYAPFPAALAGSGPTAHALEIRDGLDPERIGWRNIVLDGEGAQPRLRILSSNAASGDQSDELTRYPAELLRSPPSLKEARITLAFDAAPTSVLTTKAANPSRAEGPATVAKDSDAFARLLEGGAGGELSRSVVLAALLIAMGLGAAHAMSPGHGKTIVGAYLVGSRGTAAHAALLGAVVTLTHTAGVFVLGGLTLFASKYVLPERLYPWLGFGSGLLVAVIGAALFHERVERLLGITGSHRHLFFSHSHEAADGASSPLPNGRVTPRSLVALGVSGGIVPCPSAIVVLLSAVALNRVGFGLVLIVAFSLGLALVLIAIGLLFLYASRFLSRFGEGGLLFRVVPVVSSFAVALLGLVIAVRALVSAGMLELPV